MPKPNPLRSQGALHNLDQHTARDIEGELKQANYQCAVKSGHPEYEYCRKRRAALLKAAQRYRSLTDREQMILNQESQWEVQESDLSRRLNSVLFDGIQLI